MADAAGGGGAAAAGANKEEEKGCMGKTTDALLSVLMFIFESIMWVFKQIYNLIVAIVACIEFIWYPIKERVTGCCSWCGKKKNRSNDPHLSTFDNEV